MSRIPIFTKSSKPITPTMIQPTTFTSPIPAPVPEKPRHSLYVATPAYGCKMCNSYMTSILQLQLECYKKNIQVCFDILGNESLVQRGRNVLTERFRQSKATHLLFIDADIGFSSQSVFRLLDFDKDVVGCVYPKKYVNWKHVEEKVKRGDTEPIHQQGLDFNINIVGRQAQVDSGFVKVLDTATGFLLLTRSCIERVAAANPQLNCVNDIINESMNVKEYTAIFDCLIEDSTRRYLSEDYAFLRRAAALGIEVWVDVVSPLSHTGSIICMGDISERIKNSVYTE